MVASCPSRLLRRSNLAWHVAGAQNNSSIWKNLIPPSPCERGSESTTRPARHGCTRASPSGSNGSSHKPEPTSSRLLTPAKVRHRGDHVPPKLPDRSAFADEIAPQSPGTPGTRLSRPPFSSRVPSTTIRTFVFLVLPIAIRLPTRREALLSLRGGRSHRGVGFGTWLSFFSTKQWRAPARGAVKMFLGSVYVGSGKFRRSPYGLGVSIYGLGVEQMDSEGELRVKVWTGRKNEQADRSQICKQLFASEVNTRASRSWRSKCLANWWEYAPMPVSSRASVSSLVEQFPVGAATRVLILRCPISFARPNSPDRDMQCSQCRRAQVS
jgi:hypothetical protein